MEPQVAPRAEQVVGMQQSLAEQPFAQVEVVPATQCPDAQYWAAVLVEPEQVWGVLQPVGSAVPSYPATQSPALLHC